MRQWLPGLNLSTSQTVESGKVAYLEIEVKKLEEDGRRQNMEEYILWVGVLTVERERFVFFPGGMQALYKVDSCSMDAPVDQLTGKVRQYFIEAHEIQWDYGPTQRDGRTGKSLREAGR